MPMTASFKMANQLVESEPLFERQCRIVHVTMIKVRNPLPNKSTCVLFEKKKCMILNTERLSLRPFRIKDSNFILELVNSRAWLEFAKDLSIKTKEQARQYLKSGDMASYKPRGYGAYLVQLKSGTPIGLCSLFKRDYLSHPDIGFVFLPQFEGKGFAYEISRAILSHAKDRLRCPTILAITVRENKKAIRLLRKLGMVFIRHISSPENEKLMLFSTDTIIA
jgi:[ribosomal protein S5]-alanine N-acetyltransferase